MQAIADLADLHYVRQGDPLGLGHAVSVAREHVGDEPFAVLLGDDIMVDDARLLREMLDVHEDATRRWSRSRRCPRRDLGLRLRRGPRWSTATLVRMRSMVEKPPPEEAPSNLAVIGRYVFTPEIFDALERIEPGAGGELQLTDAIGLLAQEQTIYGCALRARPLRHRPEDRLPAGQRRARASTAPTSVPSSADSSPSWSRPSRRTCPERAR